MSLSSSLHFSLFLSDSIEFFLPSPMEGEGDPLFFMKWAPNLWVDRAEISRNR